MIIKEKEKSGCDLTKALFATLFPTLINPPVSFFVAKKDS
jgi:hypothetical protein